MTNSAEPDASNDALLEDAARWLARLHEIKAATTSEFEAWRRASPKHEQAWVQVAAPWRLLVEQAAAPELIALRGAALERARRMARARWRDRRNGFLSARSLAAAAAILVAITAGAFYVRQLPTVYRTDIGERRVVRLEDGSSISLDSHSEMSIRHTKYSREVALVRGQAHFDVAHDVERPFSVQAGDRKIVATGTSFDVDLVGSDVVVTLIEGHVVVLDRQGNDRAAGAHARGSGLPEAGVKLEPGERLVASARLSTAARAAPAVQHVNLERATAWQAGQLVFDNETLAAAVERINRYSRSKLSVADSAAGTMRFSGVFKEDDTKAFVDTVTQYLSLEESVHADGTVELRRRE
ncbi:MAG TPA: FecR domain-containing protein [Steroidobacteraceae bacterium]|jgi:transmembrane sensor|nr:FecR domain-containing protein [Steroidobacteraceae bacterium]